jgi:hypothetical protein
MRQDDWISKLYHRFDFSQKKFGSPNDNSYINIDHEQTRRTKDESRGNPKKPNRTGLL